jgi:multidrug resistance efflux pump
MQRARALRAGGAISQQDLDHAEKQTEVAESAYRAAMEQLDMLLKGTRDEQIAMAKAARDRTCAARDLLINGSRKEDIDAARAARDAAAAQLATAESTLDEMTITAPMDGIVEILDIEPGDLVGPGPVVSIIDPERLKLMVYVSAAALGSLRVGEDVEMTTDSHGKERFPAEIVFISSNGEFTPRNLQTEEERVQQVFGVKLEFDSAGGKLRAGMTATVHFPMPENGDV